MMKYFFLGSLFVVLVCANSCKNDVNNKNKSKNSNSLIEILSDSIEQNPKNSALYFKRAKLYWKDSENELALQDFYKLFRYDSTNPIYYDVFADFLIENGNLEKSITAMQMAINLKPMLPDYYIKAGKLCIYGKQYQKAIEYLNNGLRQDQQNPEAYFYKGYIYKESKNLDKAISNFQTAIEQDPLWDAPYEQLGDIYATKKNDLALSYYDNAVKANPKNESALLNKAYYYKNTNRLTQAESVYNEMVIKSPQNWDALYNLAVISYELKRYDKAKKQLAICTKIDPANPLSYFMFGKVYKALGDKKRAKESFDQALVFDSKMEDANKELKKLN